MNFNNYTIKSQEAIQRAQQLAQGLGQQDIQVEHIFKGIQEVDNNVLPFILKKLQVNTTTLNQTIEKALASYPKVQGGQMSLSRTAGEVLMEASNIAKKMNDEYVSIEHLLLAIFKIKNQVGQTLKEQGVTEKQFEQVIAELRKGERRLRQKKRIILLISTLRILLSWHIVVSLTQSSGEMMKFAVCFKFFPVVPKIILCS